MNERDSDLIICPDCGGTGQHPRMNRFCKRCGGTGCLDDAFDTSFVIEKTRGAERQPRST